MTLPKSSCCNWKMIVDAADEGTSCYVCVKCGSPCDPSQPEPPKDILLKAVEQFGIPAQMDMLIEECAELIQAVNKYRRKESVETELALISEIADVQIMLNQMRIIFPYGLIDAGIKAKMYRLEERLK